jgi:hypothetical protein
VPAPLPPLPPVKYLLQGDDPHRLRVRVITQPGGQQPVSRLARGPAHLSQARAGAAARAVLQPSPRRVVGERLGRERPLLVVKRGQQLERGRSHLPG